MTILVKYVNYMCIIKIESEVTQSWQQSVGFLWPSNSYVCNVHLSLFIVM